jgi:outer membrane receptor protein involved in Fe transport
MNIRTTVCMAAGAALAWALTMQPARGFESLEALPVFGETELMFLGEDLYMISIASRRAEPLRRAPAAVTVIQGDELRNYRTLAEVLRRIPGFFVDRNELKERIYLRGIPDSFLIMMDGVPFASDASTIDYPRGMELSLDYIEKIEIIRGPGSALWGPDAFSGVVNLVTRRGEQLQGARVASEIGAYSTRVNSGQAGFAKEGWDGYLFGSYAVTEGFERDLPGRRTRKDDYFGEIYGRISYKDLLEISGRHSHYRDFYSEREYRLQGSEYKRISFIQTTLNKSFEDSSISLQGWFQYFDSLDDYDQSRYTQFNRQYGLEAKYDKTLFGNNFATFGASLRYNDGSKTRFVFRDSSFEFFPRYDTRLYSLYFQDKWKITDTLETTVGLRYDYHSEYRRHYSPRVGISYVFWDFFSLKVLYGRAFRTPTLAVVIEESRLDPERIDSYEAELGFQYRNIFGATVSYFYNRLDNLIERNPLGEITNRGSEHIKGIEVSLRYQPRSFLMFYANYSHLFGNRQKGAKATRQVPSDEDPTQSIDTTIEGFFNVAPDNVFNCGIDIDFLRNCQLNVALNFVDRRKLVDDRSRSRRSLASHVLFDVNLFVRDVPVRNLDLALKVRNLTDRKYSTRGVYGIVEGEGSSVYVIVRYRF